MVSTGKKKQRKGRFLSQLDDCDKDIVFDVAVSSRSPNFVINSGPDDQKHTFNNIGSVRVTIENTVDVQKLEKNLIGRIAMEKGNVVGTIKN